MISRLALLDDSQLPDWLFLPPKPNSASSSSSTTGRFAPEVAIDANNTSSPWKQSIPQSSKPQRPYATLIINDFALAYPAHSVDEFLQKCDVLEQLIDRGFDIYLLRPNAAPQKLTTPLMVGDFTQAPIDRLSLSEATQLLAPVITDICADHIGLCTNKRMDGLVDLCFPDEMAAQSLEYKSTPQDNPRNRARNAALLWHIKETGKIPLYEYPLTITKNLLEHLIDFDAGQSILEGVDEYHVVPGIVKTNGVTESDIDWILARINVNKVTAISMDSFAFAKNIQLPPNVRQYIVVPIEEKITRTSNMDRIRQDNDTRIPQLQSRALKIEDIILPTYTQADGFLENTPIQSVYIAKRGMLIGKRPFAQTLHVDQFENGIPYSQLAAIISQTPNARCLKITRSTILQHTEIDVQNLLNYSHLTHFVKNLLNFPHLTHLDLSGSSIHGAVLRELMSGKPALVSIKLGEIVDGESFIIDDNMQLDNVTDIDASETTLALGTLVALSKKTRLQHLSIRADALHLNDIENLSLEHILSLRVKWPSTTKDGKFNSNLWISADKIEKLLKKIPRVKYIQLHGIYNQDRNDWSAIPLCDLRVLDLRDSQMSNPWPSNRIGQLDTFHFPHGKALDLKNLTQDCKTRKITAELCNPDTGHLNLLPHIFSLYISNYSDIKDTHQLCEMMQHAKSITFPAAFSNELSQIDHTCDQPIYFYNLVKLEIETQNPHTCPLFSYIFAHAPELRTLYLANHINNGLQPYKFISNRITHLTIGTLYAQDCSNGNQSAENFLQFLESFNHTILTVTINEYCGKELKYFLDHIEKNKQSDFKIVVKKTHFAFVADNSISSSFSSSISIENQLTLIGNKKPNKIYMRNSHATTSTSLHMSTQKRQYSVFPVCERIDGGKTPFEAIIENAYTYDFSNISENDVLSYTVPKIPFEHHLTRKLAGSHPADHAFNYTVEPQHFVKDDKTKKWVLHMYSLTPQDVIVGEVNLGGISFEPQYCQNNLCHCIVVDQLPATTQTITFNIAAGENNNLLIDLPKTVQDLYNDFDKSFEIHHGSQPTTHTMKSMRTHIKHYRCEIRPLVFLYYLNQMYIAGLSWRAVDSDDHSWVLLQYRGKYYTLDLSGASVEITYKDQPNASASSSASQATNTATTIPTLQTQQHQRKAGPITLNTLDEFKQHTHKNSINSLFIFRSRDTLDAAISYISQQFRRKTITARTNDDLQTTKHYINIHMINKKWIPEKPPGGWINDQLDDINKTHLLIDWSFMSVAQNNTCIEEQRKLQGKPLPPNMHVISFMMHDDPRLADASFRSRHAPHIFAIDFTFPLMTPEIPDQSLPIQLYDSPLFMDILFGDIIVNKDKGEYIPGKLIAHPLDEKTELVFFNPPQSAALKQLLHALKNGDPIRYQNLTFHFPPLSVTIKRGYDFSKRALCIQHVYEQVSTDQLPPVDQVLNPSTFERVLHNHIVNNFQYEETKGWLEYEKTEMSFYITRTLTIQQWCALFDHSKNKQLTLFLAPGVTLPMGLHVNTSTLATESSQSNTAAQCIVTNDCHLWINQMVTPKDIAINVSELLPDKLLYEFIPHFHGDSSIFSFDHCESGILTALKNGGTVYLTGYFSEAMIDHLSTLLIPNGYIWQDDQKQPIQGQLILVMEKPHHLLTWVSDTQTIYVNAPQHTQRVYIAHEPDDADAFEEARFNTVFQALKENPAIFIVGDPGIGKSSFIHALKRRVGAERFFTGNQRERFAQTKGTVDEPVLYVIDECTSQETDYFIYESLYGKYPRLLENQPYPIDETQKIIFIGNTVKHMPALLKNRVARIEFRPLSEDFILRRILRPIFSVHNLAGAMRFYQTHKTKSVRELQCLAIAHCAAHQPKHLPNALDHIDHFYITQSRKPLTQCLINSLNTRRFMCAANTLDDSPKYGGQTAIWIEGPAGIGKSELVDKSLLALEYTPMTDAELDALVIGTITVDTTHRYYNMSAGCDVDLMITRFHKAADQGLIVVFHEMDTALTDPLVAELNALLMSETLAFNRPTTPGFRLFATGNGKGELDRKPFPPSLRSRCQTFQLGAYPDAELMEICSHAFPHLSEQTIRYNMNEHKDSTFRELKRTLSRISHPVPTQTATTATFTTAAPRIRPIVPPVTDEKTSCVLS